MENSTSANEASDSGAGQSRETLVSNLGALIRQHLRRSRPPCFGVSAIGQVRQIGNHKRPGQKMNGDSSGNDFESSSRAPPERRACRSVVHKTRFPSRRSQAPRTRSPAPDRRLPQRREQDSADARAVVRPRRANRRNPVRHRPSPRPPVLPFDARPCGSAGRGAIRGGISPSPWLPGTGECFGRDRTVS